MKKLLLVIIAISVVFLAGSCKKDANGNTIYPMSASIDGKQWTATLPAGVLSNGYFVITGTSLTGETIIVTIKGETIGTYNLSLLPAKSDCLGTYEATLIPTTEDTYVSASGRVVLSKVDKINNLVSGTFEFTVANSSLTVKEITKGAFNDVIFK
jgi:hypothetical protein